MLPEITILHVIAHLEKGGAEKQLQLLAKCSRNEHIFCVLAGNEGRSSTSVVTIPSLRPDAIYRAVKSAISEHSVDIVQLWVPPRLTLPAAMAARVARKPIISGDRRKPRSYGAGAIKDRFGYLVHLLADRIVPNYPFLPPPISLRKLTRMERKVEVIPNGLDMVVNPVAITDLKPDRLLFVGRLVEQKRVDVLLSSLHGGLRNRLAGVEIVGDGPMLEKLQAQVAAEGLDDLVTFHGYLPDWQVRFSPANHMLVLPSASEGMSNTLFEALGLGFMPIVTRSPELSAILHDWPQRPIFIEKLNPSSIADAIEHGLDCDGDRLSRRIAEMQHHLRNFSAKAMADRYDDLYDAMLADRGTRG